MHILEVLVGMTAICPWPCIVSLVSTKPLATTSSFAQVLHDSRDVESVNYLFSSDQGGCVLY
jgi:hypothetical protein